MSYTAVTTASTASWLNTTPILNTSVTSATVMDPHPHRVPEFVRRERFEEFHREHPEVYESLRSLAFVHGCGPIRVRRLIERLRIGSDLKIDNNHIRFYTEMLKKEYPDQAHLFKTRRGRG